MDENYYIRLGNYIHSDDYKYQVEEEKRLNALLDDFLKKYTTDFLRRLPIEDYIEDENNPNSFTYILDKNLKYGSISNRITPPKKFVLYRNKTTGLIQTSSKGAKKGFGTSINEVYANTIEFIIDIIDAAKINDYDAIHDNLLSPQYKNKLAYLYSNHKQIPIYSGEHISIIFRCLNVSNDPSETSESKRKRLYEFYEENIRDQFNISPYIFMCFLYNKDYGYGHLLEKEKNVAKEITANVSDYKVVDIVASSKYESKSKSKRKGIVTSDPSSEIRKKEIGKKGEDIVEDYLKANIKELGIKEGTIKRYAGVNDHQGYDFEYTNNKNEVIKIEVKSTTQNLNEVVDFYMSSNEYNELKKDPTHFYVWIINDINHNKVIKRLRGDELKFEEPSQYRMHFHSKNK